MTTIVSISDFRQHIAEYIEKAQAGHTIILQNRKRGQQIVRLVKQKKFDPEAFEDALRKAAGVFTEKNHPEWRTKQDVINWLTKSRLADDRSF